MSGICDTCQRNQVCRKPMDGTDSCRLYMSGKESNYEKLFGTPERAARMWIEHYNILRCADCPICHDEHGKTCEIPGDCVWVDEEHGYDALLEWLRGDA